MQLKQSLQENYSLKEVENTGVKFLTKTEENISKTVDERD